MPSPSDQHTMSSPGPGATPPEAVAGSEAAREHHDFEHAVAERIEKQDPVAAEIRAALKQRIAAEDIELPRDPDNAAKIVSLTRTTETSMDDLLRHVRADAALAGRLLEMANSAVFAGSQTVYSLRMAVVRLGMTKVGEVAFHMSAGSKNLHREKRSNMLARAWKYAQAVGFACEELAARVPGEQADGCFLTGLFHDVAAPLVIESIGRLERAGQIPPQSDSRVLGLVDNLSHEYTLEVVKLWKIPKESRDAIRLQNTKVRERRGKPLAHLLVCAKAVAAELGMGVRPQPIDFSACRDFHFLGLDDPTKLESARVAAVDKMKQIARH